MQKTFVEGRGLIETSFVVNKQKRNRGEIEIVYNRRTYCENLEIDPSLFAFGRLHEIKRSESK